jgi:hypothetical protein
MLGVDYRLYAQFGGVKLELKYIWGVGQQRTLITTGLYHSHGFRAC